MFITIKMAACIRVSLTMPIAKRDAPNIAKHDHTKYLTKTGIEYSKILLYSLKNPR